MSDAQVTAVAPVGMITLRGDLEVLGKALKAKTKCALPAQRMRTSAGDRSVLWMSRDELLLTCDYDEAPALAETLAKALEGEHATLAVVSDARAVFDMSGPDAQAALEKLAPVDFARMADAEVRRTRLAQVPAALWRQGDGWRVVCFRSVGGYVSELLRTASA